jgi:hypothetical protein
MVEIDVGDDESAVNVTIPGAPHDLGHQRHPALLQELVVDGLIQVAEQVDVAPAQLDTDGLLARAAV